MEIMLIDPFSPLKKSTEKRTDKPEVARVSDTLVERVLNSYPYTFIPKDAFAHLLKRPEYQLHVVRIIGAAFHTSQPCDRE